MLCLKITDEKWSKLKMCIDFIASLPSHSNNFKLRKKKEGKKKKKKSTTEHQAQTHKKITVPTNIWIKDIALQSFFFQCGFPVS